MRLRFALALLAAAIVAACGGGGGGTSPGGLPPAANNPGVANPSSAVAVALTIKIPNGSSSSLRHPHYVSSGTQSIGVVVTNQGQTPSPAQYVNVSTCPQVGGVTTCSVSIVALPGNDVFGVTAYSAPSGGGSALSVGSISATIAAGAANITDTLTLGGVVASIAITPGVATLPLGQSTTLNVVAKDASGATIVGTYDNPITLSGSNLVFSATSLPDSTTASSVSVNWNMGFAGPSASTITASADGQTGTLALTPATGMAFYQTGTNPATDEVGFKMIAGPDGNLYYTSLGPIVCAGPSLFCTTSSGAVHQFNPATDTDTEIALQSEGAGLLFSSDGALWIAGGTAPTQGGPNYIYRMAPGSFSAGALTPIPVPTTNARGANIAIRMLAQDGSGNLWFVDAGGGRYMSIPVSGPYQSSSISYYRLPRGPVGTTGDISGPVVLQIYYASGVLAAVDKNSGTVDVINPSTAAVTAQYLTNLQASFGANGIYDSSQPYDGTADGTTMYIGQIGNWALAFQMGDLEAFNPSNDTFTTLPIVYGSVQTVPGPMSKSGNLLYYGDLDNGALGSINLASGDARLIPIVAPVSTNPASTAPFYTPDGVGALSDGTAWFTCLASAQTFQPLCVGHTIYLSGWSVWPSSAIAIDGAGLQAAQIMGIMESPSANSGPFSETSSNTSVCTIVNASGHNFTIVGQAAGACIVTVEDKNSVTQTVNVTVTTTSGTVQVKRREGIL